MANIQAISYQTSVATTTLGLDSTDHRFANAALRIHAIARDVFHIQEGDVTASITADRIVIVHNAQQHILHLSNGQLTADGQAIGNDSIYHAFGYLQGLLKIEALPIAQIAQPSLAPSITRSPDGNTVNITLNMGNTSLDAGRHVEDLTQLLKSTFETALGAQQRNIDTLSAESTRLKAVLGSQQSYLESLDETTHEQQRNIRALTEERDQAINEVIPQLREQIDALLKQQRESEERYLRELEKLKAKAEHDAQQLQSHGADVLAELNL